MKLRLRLSTRLISSVILIEAVMLSALVLNSVRLISSSHYELLENSIHEESRLLAASLSPGLAASDRAVIRDVLDLLKDKPELVYVQIFDRRGKLIDAMGRRPESVIEGQIIEAEQDVELYGQQLGTLKLGFSTEIVRNITAKTRTQNTLIAVLELILSVIATIFIGLLITRNLRKLEEGAEALSRGEHDHRIDIDSHDEIGDVARSFNDMAQYLSDSRKALEGKNLELTQQAEQLNTLLNGVNAAIMEADPSARHFSFVSQGATDMLGYPQEAWLEEDFLFEHMHSEDRPMLEKQLHNQPQENADVTMDFRMRPRFGGYIWVRCIASIDEDAQGTPRMRGLLMDITEQMRNAEHILYLAEHDTLTGLYNRHRFQKALNAQTLMAERYAQPGALLFLDLDQFKYINDTQGHQAGDALLQNVAQSMKATLRESDIIGRLGGDEFGIVLPYTAMEDACVVANNLLTKIKNIRVQGENRPLQVTGSIGIVEFPKFGNSATELLAKADIAMYNAKKRGKNHYKQFDESDHATAGMQEKVQWEERINWALEHNGFVLHYQPVYQLSDMSIQHYEVLLRLLGEDDQLIYPGEFLSVAERFGAIRDIDFWVLEHSIATQGQSNKAGTPAKLAINLSGRHFGDAALLDWIRECISDYEADPAGLVFEITETAAMENFTKAVEFAHELHSLGCKLALDDFGVGYSSFHYLKNFPVDMLKIDGSFIRKLDQDHFDQVFVKAISELSKGLGIKTVAEFVETADVLGALEQLDIDMAQGFHLARPRATLPQEHLKLSRHI